MPETRTTGHAGTRLVVLGGNSGSGKSTTARELRVRLGRGVAWVEQDHLRRIVLREHDVAFGINIGLIDQTARYALDHRYDVILEGILDVTHYGAMLERLIADHAGRTQLYYFDISFEETVRRHTTRPLANEFTPDTMRAWYRPRDLLGQPGETVIDESSTIDDTVGRILVETGWATRPPERAGDQALIAEPASRPAADVGARS